MPVDYEYRGLMAEAWDLLRAGVTSWPDSSFYRALIEQRDGPVLDVGCGTGRLLLEYRRAGFDIDGIDNSPEMLGICGRNAEAVGVDLDGRLFEQEMDQMMLPRRYATIIVPSSSFQLVTDKSHAARAMRKFREHLEPAGLLVMPFMSKLWPGRRIPSQMEWSEWHKLSEARRPEDGATVRRWIRARYDHELQLEHEENRYEVLHDGVVTQTELHSCSPCVRWYSQKQARALYGEAEFEVIATTSGFTFEPVSSDDTTFCLIGKRS